MIRIPLLAVGLIAIGSTGCTTADAANATSIQAVSPSEWAQKCRPWDDWDVSAPPFRVQGDTWYVGTCGITSLLVETSDGLVLLDSGTQIGADVVLANIRALGHDPRDVKLILPSHEHFDHVGGFAMLQSATGAKIVSSIDAAPVFRSGNADPADPQYGMHEPMPPVEVSRVVKHGEAVSLGGTTFNVISTPGHTPGALSWQWESCAASECRTIVYADSLSPVSRDGYRFSDRPDYVARYRAGLNTLAMLDCDILLTPHPSASEIVKRATAGSFSGEKQCEAYADAIRRRLGERLEKEEQEATN